MERSIRPAILCSVPWGFPDRILNLHGIFNLLTAPRDSKNAVEGHGDGSPWAVFLIKTQP